MIDPTVGPSVVEINTDPARGEFLGTPFGVVEPPPRFCDGELIGTAPALVLVEIDTLAQMFTPEGFELEGSVAHVDRDGIMRAVYKGGVLVYELHPARFTDDDWPPIYLGVRLD